MEFGHQKCANDGAMGFPAHQHIQYYILGPSPLPFVSRVWPFEACFTEIAEKASHENKVKNPLFSLFLDTLSHFRGTFT